MAYSGKIKIDIQVLETIKTRGITELDICVTNVHVENKISFILQSLPQLERLSLDATTRPIYKALRKAASSHHLVNIKKLAFGNVLQIIGYSQHQYPITDLLMQLPKLEEVSFGSVSGGTAWDPRNALRVILHLLNTEYVSQFWKPQYMGPGDTVSGVMVYPSLVEGTGNESRRTLKVITRLLQFMLERPQPRTISCFTLTLLVE